MKDPSSKGVAKSMTNTTVITCEQRARTHARAFVARQAHAALETPRTDPARGDLPEVGPDLAELRHVPLPLHHLCNGYIDRAKVNRASILTRPGTRNSHRY